MNGLKLRLLGEFPNRVRDAGERGLAKARSKSPLLDRFWEIYKIYSAAEPGQQAAALAYYGFLSLFPLLVAVGSIIGVLFRDQARAEHALRRVLAQFAPGLVPILQPSLETVTRRSAALGLIGGGLFVWSGAKIVDSAHQVVASIYGTPRLRRHRAAVLTIEFLVLSASIVGVGIMVASFALWLAGFQEPMRTGRMPGRGPLGVVLILTSAFVTEFALALVGFKFLSGRNVRLRLVWQAGLVTALGWWTLLTTGSLLLQRLSSKEVASYYGIAAATITLLLVFNGAARVFLFGAEWCAWNLRMEETGKES